MTVPLESVPIESVKAVRQFVEFLVASQHSPTLDAVHFGPPAASVALAQFLPVPTFLQKQHLLRVVVKWLWAVVCGGQLC